MAYTTLTFPTIAKYVKENGNSFTWQKVGIHFATLNALVKKGYLSKNSDGSYSVTPKGKIFANIEALTQGREYFVLRKEGATLGMMCSIKGSDLLDAWERPYELDENGVWLSYTEPNAQQKFIGNKGKEGTQC